MDSECSYFFKLGRSLLTHRRRHDLPVLCKRPLDRMELQSLGPYFLTWFTRTSSSSAFHGPFLTSIPQNSFFFLTRTRENCCPTLQPLISCPAKESVFVFFFYFFSFSIFWVLQLFFDNFLLHVVSTVKTVTATTLY